MEACVQEQKHGGHWLRKAFKAVACYSCKNYLLPLVLLVLFGRSSSQDRHSKEDNELSSKLRSTAI